MRSSRLRLPRLRRPRVPWRHTAGTTDPAHVAAWTVLGLVVTVVVVVMALGAGVAGGPVLSSQGDWSGSRLPAGPPGQTASYAVADPAPLTHRLHAPSLLVVAGEEDPSLARRVRATGGVATAEPIGLASLVVMGRTVNAAAVDPASYRRLTSGRTARMEAVWDAVARGDVAVTHGIAAGLRLDLGGEVVPGTRATGPRVPIGAIATTVPGIDLVVNRPRGRQLGLPSRNAAVVTLEQGADTEAVRAVLQSSVDRTGPGGSVTDLTVEPGSGVYAARLAGGSVADAVGSFGYTYFDDGTVEPDPDWVAASIVTGEVPILGQVTCHRVMLPQLRGALQAVVDAGLAATVDPGDFGGCYSPRFIERDPSRGLSLHTWGIAVDLNVTGNQVGTAGTIDPRVVEIFDRWGFAWGGRWRVPDPMHFELAALVR